MNATASIARFGWRVAGAAGLVTALALGSGAALAQKKKAEPAKQASAPQSAWVKLCENAPVLVKGKDGKQERAEKKICLTHHERLDGNTGMVLVSAAIRDVEGQDKKHMMVMVPLGMAIQPGLRAKVYDAAMWAKAQKNEKVDDSKIPAEKLNFSLCHPAGCTAEIEMTDALLTKLKGGAGLMVFSINANGQVIAFPVPLTGFSAALSGAPIDNVKYSEARKSLMKQIALRQQQLVEEYKKKQAEKGGAAAAPGAKK
ncbi:MAG: invasion associated locus B family protein [Hyphomicrobiaceae bacterium]